MKLQLKRPLVFFDIESTGPEKETDRIIQLGFLKILPNDEGERTWSTYVNPGVPIPPEATEVHGITDVDVKDAPSFASLAPKLWGALSDCDLGGYNARRFDVPFLINEFARVPGYESAGAYLGTVAIIDPMRIFHQREPRDLAAAHRFFVGTDFEGAHEAMADVRAAWSVLQAQLERYEDLPTDVDSLSDVCAEESVDLERKLVWKNNEVVIAFGKMRGKSLRWLLENDLGFLQWMLNPKNSFPSDTKAIIQHALSTKTAPTRSSR